MRVIKLCKWSFVLCLSICCISLIPYLLYQQHLIKKQIFNVYTSKQFLQMLCRTNCSTETRIELHEKSTREAQMSLYHQSIVKTHLFGVYTSRKFLQMLGRRNCPLVARNEEDLPANDTSLLVDLKDFKFIIDHIPCTKENSPTLLVMVHSAPTNFNKRMLIRNTWGSVLQGNLIFVLGYVESPEMQSKLIQESVQYGDLLQGSFKDAYRNMTYKHVTALKWMNYFCPSAQYVLKADDDTFINTPTLLKVLSKERCHLTNMIICRLWKSVKVKRKGYKWTVSQKEFPLNVFPDYCSGTAILYSGDSARLLYRKAQQSPYFWVDDVHVTGVLAKQLNITHLSVTDKLLLVKTRLNESVETIMCSQHVPFLFSHHNMTHREMHTLWKYVQKC